MKVIGITGQVGSGKSTVLKLLNEICNCTIIMADDVARELMEKDQEAYKAVVDAFGNIILNDNSEIDRKHLANIVFKDKNSLKLLNSLVHPIVKKHILSHIEILKKNNKVDYCFVEAAVFFEDSYDKFCQEVWYIYVNDETRRERLKSSRGYSDEKITDILNNQQSEEFFREKCDKFIDNSGNINETKALLESFL